MFSLPILLAIALAVIALLLFLEPEGLGKNSFENRLMNHEFRSSKHKWEKSHLKSFYFCYLCHKLTNGWFSDVLECKKCGIIIHKICRYLKLRKPECKFIVAKSHESKFYHQWRQCTTTASANCSVCSTVCVGLETYICIWCHRVRHGECQQDHLECDYGSLRKFIIEPTEVNCNAKFPNHAFNTLRKSAKIIKERTSESESEERHNEDIRFSIKDLSKRPVVVLVNKKSGGQTGNEVIKEFYRAVNPLQVISILDEGLQKLKLFTKIPELILVIAGGDGTVCSVLNFVKTIPEWQKKNPPAVVLPLGTGNDLSRSLGWSGTVDEINVGELLKSYVKGERSTLDRWKMTIKKGEEESEFTVYNYIGIGLDGKICKDFHDIREKYPQLFFSQFSNKLIYTQMGAIDLLKGNQLNLHKIMRMKVDGQEVPVEGYENIILMNILHWGGGVTNLWPQNHPSFSPQSFSDGKIELIGLSDMVHMGQVQIGLDEPFPIAQGRIIELISLEANGIIPLQIDGEPLEIMSPATIRIQRKDQVDVLTSKYCPRNSIHHLINEAVRRNIISPSQFEQIMSINLNERMSSPRKLPFEDHIHDD